MQMSFFWDTCVSSRGCAVVVDGRVARITPLRHALVPPPMSAAAILFPSPLVSVAIGELPPLAPASTSQQDAASASSTATAKGEQGQGVVGSGGTTSCMGRPSADGNDSTDGRASQDLDLDDDLDQDVDGDGVFNKAAANAMPFGGLSAEGHGKMCMHPDLADEDADAESSQYDADVDEVIAGLGACGRVWVARSVERDLWEETLQEATDERLAAGLRPMHAPAPAGFPGAHLALLPSALDSQVRAVAQYGHAYKLRARHAANGAKGGEGLCPSSWPRRVYRYG